MYIPLSGSKWVAVSDHNAAENRNRVILRYSVVNRMNSVWSRSQSVDDIFDAAQPWMNVTNLNVRYIAQLNLHSSVRFTIDNNTNCNPETPGFYLTISDKNNDLTKPLKESFINATIECQTSFERNLMIAKLTHIWGLVIGLNQSADPTSAMFPKNNKSRQLNKRDIFAAQVLYGPNLEFEGDLMPITFKPDR